MDRSSCQSIIEGTVEQISSNWEGVDLLNLTHTEIRKLLFNFGLQIQVSVTFVKIIGLLNEILLGYLSFDVKFLHLPALELVSLKPLNFES